MIISLKRSFEKSRPRNSNLSSSQIDFKKQKVEYARKENLNVETLQNTIKFMKQNIYNFQPALEIIQNDYGKKLGIKYSEASSYG